MIRIIRAAQRYTRDAGWLQTAWLFSFDEYYDPENVQFSILRVFNDDTVQPGGGFPLHPHREAEIVTIPLSGTITHEDSMGNMSDVRAGSVQRMSAGSGVRHAEMNRGDTPVHLYQIWFLPETAELTPSYDQRTFDPAIWHNRLAPLVSGRDGDGVVTMHADATIYRAQLEPSIALSYAITDARSAFLYVNTGSIQVNDQLLNAHDQARITGESYLDLHAVEHAQLVLIDLPPA